jgi:hypothetical protein
MIIKMETTANKIRMVGCLAIDLVATPVPKN